MAGWAAANDARDELVVWKLKDHAWAWIFRFEMRRWLDDRDFWDQSVVGCPLVMDKATGQVHQYGSGHYDKFAAWLDGGLPSSTLG
jgi:hypothetical protein